MRARGLISADLQLTSPQADTAFSASLALSAQGPRRVSLVPPLPPARVGDFSYQHLLPSRRLIFASRSLGCDHLIPPTTALSPFSLPTYLFYHLPVNQTRRPALKMIEITRGPMYPNLYPPGDLLPASKYIATALPAAFSSSARIAHFNSSGLFSLPYAPARLPAVPPSFSTSVYAHHMPTRTILGACDRAPRAQVAWSLRLIL